MNLALEHSVRAFLLAVEQGIPELLSSEIDFSINQGNLAVLVLAEDGSSWGRHFGSDKAKMRETSLIAWKKALQVWVTGYATGEYEKLVWSGTVDWSTLGIMKPDFIGWEGGLPIRLADGTRLAVAFSGFRGETDAALMRRSAQAVGATLAT